MSDPKLATKADLTEFYQRILPYLGNAAAGFTPIGTIIAVFGETAPANYLICDGTAYNKADYPELAAHLLALTDPTPYVVDGDNTKFKVPDLRGEFLRGTGTNSHAQMGSGASVGVHQDASGVRDYWIRPNGSSFHLRMSEAEYQQAISSGYPPLVWPKDSAGTDFTKFRDLVINGTLDPQGTNPGDLNTMAFVRPTNTSVLFCIATKNIYLNPSLDYSTDEKVVGSWIGGETLYQKTLTITCPTVTSGGGSPVYGSTLLGVKTADIGRIVKIEGSMQNGGLTVPVPFINPQGYVVSNVGDDNGDIRVYITTNHTAMSNQDVLLTLQYTKATD